MILISKFKKGFIEIINNFEKNLINLQSIDNIVFELIKNNDSARKTLEIFDKNKHEMENTKIRMINIIMQKQIVRLLN